MVQMALTRLVLLIAMLFLPLGLNNALAAAATHHAPKQNSKGAFAECTMACASALPAMDRVSDEIRPMARTAFLPLPAQPLHGLHPDTATPPPKAS